MKANKENIEKYGRVIESVVAGFTGKIGKIISVWENENGSGYTLQFPTAISPHNIDKLHIHHSFVEIIDKIYTSIPKGCTFKKLNSIELGEFDEENYAKHKAAKKIGK